ncbi:MAG: hypothetical protein HY864_15865 [Chloroflexi bacterium]|nr:hypothetical protein [Chloroflexota bacterium]
MSDQHTESLQSLKVWKTFLYSALFITIAAALLSFRKLIVGALVRFAAYMVWSLNIIGRVIPQQVLWILLLLLILYIAVGSFYGKKSGGRSSRKNAVPVIGPVETRARWIEERHRGTYFKWQLANLLGKIHLHIQETVRYGNSRSAPLIPPNVQDFLSAGLNTTYADYSSPSLFQKTETTPLDIQLEQVVDYLEEQLEIKDERQDD